ncbi:uncharacterized protein GGS22DRAFT_198383 [Annulohypoxylon maeteangense]|uniref:uncharacterized protein n=1 Tax=Annulohypoxylon maeteangense TaxID=1927788 RepID=UPI0020077061|nr:uncharacterized protein GGS22DRAFT_198383 [Annulohypoxylon maeteangense]KAI0880061.1 hypothetical protein GGS22DRAFT_198383 [Annulohypoxylon maeteangense]
MVSQVASVPRSLESLPTRPPTPPREKKQDVPSSSKQILSSQPIDTRLNLHTPPNYTSDIADPSNVSSRRSRKKVGFLSQAEYREAPTYAGKENVRKQATPASALSSVNSVKPVKSILKQTSSPILRNSLELLASGDEGIGQINIVTMLDSTIKQLAGADRDSKIDAYTMLARALKASNNLPDRIALHDKMSLFMQFIQRDVTTKDSSGTIDSSMVNHALTLLCTFFHFPAIASTLSSDFGIFIIDHCIKSFDDPLIPKDVIRHLMQVVACQDFSGKVMTADRVGRLITTLHKIEEHIKGKSIIMSRILIYRRLVKQAKSQMATHSDWLLDLFTDMLSSLKEIRLSAIALGLEASFAVGKEKQLSRRVMEILQLQVEETRYIEYYMERLMSMTKDKTESASVPQVWSVIILLLRCPVDRWEFFTPFLEIIQRCFNSGDYHTKLEANYAWNRLVYCLHFNESSFSKTIGTICQPFLSQLRRKGGNKQADEIRKVVVAGVCNLYYYAFGPNSSATRIESYWNICVQPLILQLTPLKVDGKSVDKTAPIPPENLTQSILMLTSLFNSSTARLWKEDRVAENTLIRPDELPALDPKWVRRNAKRVFDIVEPILKSTFLELANPESPSCRLWRALVGAVATAASKEVKVSSETATFMAQSFNTLVSIWSNGLGQPDVEPDSQQKFLDATQTYISTMAESLGVLPFTEKLLSLQNSQNEKSFKLVATPSNRSGKSQGLVRTPLHHLFSMLSTLPPGVPDNDGLLNLIRVVFDPFILSRPSSNGKVDLARELMQTLPGDVSCSYGSWVFISDILSLSLESSQSSYQTNTSSSQPTTIGHEYREIVKHLERGIKSTPNLPWEQWHSLFQLLVTRVTYEAGEAGCAIMIVEPFAKSLWEFTSSCEDAMPYNLFKTSIELVAAARQPRDRQALDAARRRLWGTSIAGSRSASFDPFDNFYRLTNHLLRIAYLHFVQYDENEIIAPLLTEITSFLARCNPSLVLKSLLQLQDGISFWVQDADTKYSSRQSSKVSEAVKALWSRICGLLSDRDSSDNLQLDAIEELLCAAFLSKHKDIVNAVSAVWNHTFEHAEEIQYPEKLKEVLVSIHSCVDIVLPGLDLSLYGSAGPEISFVESQDDLEVSNPPLDNASLHQTPTTDRPSSRRSATPEPVRLSLSSERRPDITPNTSRPRSVRQGTTPRPRHDDSQIQFAPIESSSPSQDVAESQMLTDRQKEVRERQRENAAMFPHIRSSAEKRKSPHPTAQHQEKKDLQSTRAATPERSRELEDYVSSTPTPRRGQAPIIDDHEMVDDVPSSPPEPRRNLLEEMRPQSKSSAMFLEFPVSSSPVPGSPVPKQQPIFFSESHVEQEDMEIDQGDMGTSDHDEEETPRAKPKSELDSGGVQYSAQDQPDTQALTPRTTRSMGKALGSSLRSEREVFVDALSSQVPRTPRTLRSNAAAKKQIEENTMSSSQPKDRSFELSDGEERSFARLVVELDSRKSGSQSKTSKESPEKQRRADKSDVESFTVDLGSRKTRSQSKKDGDFQSPVAPTSSAEIETPRSSSKRSKRKRKRQAEKGHEPNSSHKKRKHRKNAEANAEVETKVEAEANTESVYNSHISEDDTTVANKITVAVDGGMELDTDMSFSEVQEPIATGPVQQDQPDSSPVSFDDSLIERESERESDTEAVNLQIITEASQQSEFGPTPAEMMDEDMQIVNADAEVVDQAEDAKEITDTVQRVIEEPRHVEEPIIQKSQAEIIMDALKGSLEGLRTARLTRDEVNKIEDMFFDIKKELYQAESRGRH